MWKKIVLAIAVFAVCVNILFVNSPLAGAIAWQDEVDTFMPYSWDCTTQHTNSGSVYQTVIPNGWSSTNSGRSYNERNFSGDRVVSVAWQRATSGGVFPSNFASVHLSAYPDSYFTSVVLTSTNSFYYSAGERMEIGLVPQVSDATFDIVVEYFNLDNSNGFYYDRWEQYLNPQETRRQIQASAGSYQTYFIREFTRPAVVTKVEISVTFNSVGGGQITLALPQYTSTQYYARYEVLKGWDTIIRYPRLDEVPDATAWLSQSISGFWTFQLLPNLTIGGIFSTVFGLMLLIVFVKIFSH